MNYDVNAGNDVTEIRFIGRLSYDDHAVFHSLITALAGGPGHRIIFDLSRLELIDSAGLGMFIVAKDLTAKRAMSLHLRGARGVVKKLMDLVKFDDVVPSAR